MNHIGFMPFSVELDITGSRGSVRARQTADIANQKKSLLRRVVSP
jgi:hypothetical protein